MIVATSKYDLYHIIIKVSSHNYHIINPLWNSHFSYYEPRASFGFTIRQLFWFPVCPWLGLWGLISSSENLN